MKKFKLIFAVLCLGIFVVGCGNVNFHNHKADDTMTRMINEAIGGDVYYQYKKEEENSILFYEFYMENENIESVCTFMDIVDYSLSKTEDKVMVVLGCYIPGGMDYVIRIQNYSDPSVEKADMPGAKIVTALYPVSESEVFTNPVIYKHLEDVRYFRIDSRLQKKAEEKGIDWYDVWNNLERVEIF